MAASLAGIAALVLLLARPEGHRPKSNWVLYYATGLIKPVQEVCADYMKKHEATV